MYTWCRKRYAWTKTCYYICQKQIIIVTWINKTSRVPRPFPHFVTSNLHAAIRSRGKSATANIRQHRADSKIACYFRTSSVGNAEKSGNRAWSCNLSQNKTRVHISYLYWITFYNTFVELTLLDVHVMEEKTWDEIAESPTCLLKAMSLSCGTRNACTKKCF